MVKLLVLMPAYNEAGIIRYSLSSIAKQTLKPSKVILCDNSSNDGTPLIASKTLSEFGIDHKVLSVRRYPEIGKYNINIVYNACARESLKDDVDFVAIIEADVILTRNYFENVIRAFINDKQLCIASGKLLRPDDTEIVVKPFPLPSNYIGLPGSARIYRYECWHEITTKYSFLRLPAWDTDHVVLAALLGYRIAKVDAAVAYTRPDRPFKGIGKGRVDAMHGAPLYWALYKAFQYRDFKYLLGYIECRLNNCSKSTYDELKAIYRNAYRRELLRMFSFIEVLR